jgi:hypothetical protein
MKASNPLIASLLEMYVCPNLREKALKEPLVQDSTTIDRWLALDA